MNKKTNRPLRLLAFGAHPDDCDIAAGGLALLYAGLGHRVRFVSVTNGDAGHNRMGRGELARKRFEEAQNAARSAGIEYHVWDIHDGRVEPSLENRRRVIREIREFKPDLVLTHRPFDYHPDHRYTGLLVQEAAYFVTVPNICPLTPHFWKKPIILFMKDDFQKPIPFQACVVIDTDPVMEGKWRMLHCHASQFYEWIPSNFPNIGEAPAGDAERLNWLKTECSFKFLGFSKTADRYRKRLGELYGKERGKNVGHAEAFDFCEHGRKPDSEEMRILFPFFKRAKKSLKTVPLTG